MRDTKDGSPVKGQLQSKLGGSHTTIIGGRKGKKLVRTISAHTEVKRIIPSVITVRGKGPSGGVIYAKILRPDDRGNLRMLLAHGTSAQEIRIITTVGDAVEGERIMNELNAMLSED